MNWPSAALQTGQIPWRSDDKARAGHAGGCLEIHHAPAPRRDLTWGRADAFQREGLAVAADLDVAALVLARRHVRRRCGWAGRPKDREARRRSVKCNSASVLSAIAALRASTSAISALARSSSRAALAWPISLEASLRRAWAACSAVCAPRSASSSARIARRSEKRRIPSHRPGAVVGGGVVADGADVVHEKWGRRCRKAPFLKVRRRRPPRARSEPLRSVAAPRGRNAPSSPPPAQLDQATHQIDIS